MQSSYHSRSLPYPETEFHPIHAVCPIREEEQWKKINIIFLKKIPNVMHSS